MMETEDKTPKIDPISGKWIDESENLKPDNYPANVILKDKIGRRYV